MLEAQRHPCGAVCVNVRWFLDLVFPQKGEEQDMVNGSKSIAMLLDAEDDGASQANGANENDANCIFTSNKKQMNSSTYIGPSSSDVRDSAINERPGSSSIDAPPSAKKGHGLRRTRTYHNDPSSASFGLNPPSRHISNTKRSLSLSNRQATTSDPHPTDESQFVSWAT